MRLWRRQSELRLKDLEQTSWPQGRLPSGDLRGAWL